MSEHKYKFQMYKHLQANAASIYAEARKAADEIGIPREIRGKFGLTGAISGCPSPLRKDIMEAAEKGGREVIPLARLVDEIREIVKDVYGDEYDAAPINTCEAALWVTFDTLFTPPMLGRGDNYRTRYIAPYEKHLHHQGSYGRPYPARFKDIFADRGCTAGELGFYGKRQHNLDAVIVPLVGARYDVHGIKYHPVPLLTGVDPQASAEKIKNVAAVHATMLSGITSLGYDTPGYGYGVKDAEGTPVLQKLLAEIAHQYDVPYVVDNAWGLPFIGHDPRKTGADVIVYSMDKATGAATSGLIIGREEYMVPIRRALGMHGDRYGTTASYGKAAYVTFDPGKEALLTQIQALKVLRDSPEVVTRPVDELERIVVEEFAALPARLREGIIITKSYNSGAVEVNYEGTWKDGKMGIPIFTIEDMYAGSNLIQSGLAQMGIIPTIAYDANIFISPGLGTTDEEGMLKEQEMRLAVRGLVRLIEIICKYAGII
ncbi:aminotransferase class V-fold PLP-dependent enzyme [Desulfovirgula thermocuniculi]|uniref:aminotransferase class V-fold PLP-dependent enzyme n=1 Tax=Desulfovirgula thermocuniculi TaxID=348842 RepID=UPI000429B704|nr:aminotransferase class V-fold PLP-dependent enzyme [Desulfovirgula thermocuniculi]